MINKNVLSLKQSATLLINEKVKELRRSGAFVSHFGFGQSPFPIFQSIVSSLQEHADNNHYLPVAGLESLRAQIASFLSKEQGIETSKESIFIGPGSKELLYQTILIFEAEFLIPQGSWVSYIPQIQSKGGSYHILKTQLRNDFKLTASELASFMQQQETAKEFVLILNSPNNPTGGVYTDKEYQELAVVCKQYGITVMSDEIYSQINFEAPYSPSISRFYPEGTIVFGGLSKVFSAGGYRLGYMVLPEKFNHLQNVYKSLFSETFSCVSSPVQYAALNAYEYGEDLKSYVAHSSAILKGVSSYIYKAFTAMGIECTKAQGAFYMTIGFNPFRSALAKVGISTSSQLANYLLEKYHVAMLPGSDFGFQEDDLFFRIAFVDFNGVQVMEAYKAQGVIDAEFIAQYCPSIYKGVQMVQQFINDVK